MVQWPLLNASKWKILFTSIIINVKFNMKIKIKSHHFFIYLANNHAPIDIPKYKRI